MREKKILVTGGNGLVGSALYADVRVGSEIDLRDTQKVNELFQQTLPTHVIHCAAKVGGVGGNMNYKADYFYDNIMINTNVIEAARLNGVERLVNFLSVCVFPDNVMYPLDESKIHLGEPHHSNNAYAYAKRMSDIQINAYREQYGINYTSVIPTNVYGPNDNFSLIHGHVIPMLIHKLQLAQRDNTDFVVWGSGKSLREFIFSRDLAKMTEVVLHEYQETTPIILSTSEEISIRDVVDLLVKEFDFRGRVVFDKTKPEGQHRRPSDNSKILKYLPDFKFTPIEQGLKETVQWFKENYETTRK
jgi:GDP-L-fucose synthase